MQFIKKLIRKFLNFILFPIHNRLYNIQNQMVDIQTQLANLQTINKLFIEDILINNSPKYQNPKHIVKYLSHVYSQNYEDSVIAEIFSRIGTISKTFLEIGIGDGAENNTRFLLELGWSGVWIEGDLNNVKKANSKFANYINAGKLKIIHSIVTIDNINNLIDFDSVDLLSIDIDMNTSHIWRELNLKARVAVIEYNSSIHPSVCFEVPYNEKSQWDGSNYFGASLKMLEKIAEQKEMCLVGCEHLGINAFFVKGDLVGDKFISPYTSEQHYDPPSHHLLKHRGHHAK